MATFLSAGTRVTVLHGAKGTRTEGYSLKRDVEVNPATDGCVLGGLRTREVEGGYYVVYSPRDVATRTPEVKAEEPAPALPVYTSTNFVDDRTTIITAPTTREMQLELQHFQFRYHRDDVARFRANPTSPCVVRAKSGDCFYTVTLTYDARGIYARIVLV